MRHENVILGMLSNLTDRFYLSRKSSHDKNVVIQQKLNSLADFKEAQFRELVNAKFEEFETKIYHADAELNEIAKIGARIFADDLLSELNEQEI